MKFLCDQCKAKYQIADEKVQGKTLRMKCRKCGHVIEIRALAPGEQRPSSLPPSGPLTHNPTMQLDSLSDEAAAAMLANPKIPTAPKAPFSPSKPLTGTQRAVVAPKPGAPPRPDANRPLGQTQTKVAPPTAPRPTAKADATGQSVAPPSALASAFNKSVAARGEPSPPAGATDPPAEEWYVAIDEVPVGPIRLTELRAKYGAGAVTDDSLVWREGFEEWRPLRTLADLHTIVREEVSQPRGSLLPGTPRPQPARPTSGAMSAARSSPTPRPPAATPSPSNARNNVIPFQRQAGVAARKIEEEPEDQEVTRIGSAAIFAPMIAESAAGSAVAKAGISADSIPSPRIVQDPFGSNPSPVPTTAPTGAMVPPPPSEPISAPQAAMFPISTEMSRPPPRDLSVVERLSIRARGVSSGMVALIAAGALLLGVVVTVLLVRRMTIVQEKIVERQVNVPVSVFVPVPGAAPTASEAPSASSGPKVAKVGGGSNTAPTTTAAAPTSSSTSGKKWGGVDDGPAIPTDNGTKAAGAEGALDGKLVGEVAQRNAIGVRKVCYEKLVETGPADAKINVHVRPDGGVSQVDLLSGSPPTFASCVQKLAYNWHFPASGSGGTFPIPYIFK